MIWKDWIEILFEVEPDAGSGALEWAIAGGLLVVGVVFAVLARAEWRRPRMAG